MIKKEIVIKTFLILLVTAGILGASDGPAFFYRPEATLTIMSEYTLFNGAAPPQVRAWEVAPEPASDGGTRLRFFPETAAGAEAVCELLLFPAGGGGEIRWRAMGKSAEKTSVTGLLLAPGFPAPCDVLPLGAGERGKVYQEKSQAGGSVFVKSYRLSSEPFGAAEAGARGWLRAEAPGATELIMFTVTDEKGGLSVRQLWPVGGSWWLYEETPLRRSWLIR